MTLALGTALLVPLRDDRRGRRASLPSGNAPLQADFRAVGDAASAAVSSPAPPAAADATSAGTGVAARPDDAITSARVDPKPGAITAVVDRFSQPGVTPIGSRTNYAEEAATTDELVPKLAARTDANSHIDRRTSGATAVRPNDGAGGSPTADDGRDAKLGDASPVSLGDMAPRESERASLLRGLRGWFGSIASLARANTKTKPPEAGTDVASRSDDADYAARSTASHDLVVERSFAAEVATLLGHARTQATTESDRRTKREPPVASASETAQRASDRHAEGVARTPDGTDSDAFESEDGGHEDRVADVTSPREYERFAEARPHVKSASSDDTPPCDGAFDAGGSGTSAGAPRHVPAATRVVTSAYERVVPITRLPLRPQAAIAWPALAPEHRTSTRAERHVALAALARDGHRHDELFVAAYRQEDADGRLLALAGLARTRDAAFVPVYGEALRAGSDDERSCAVDALDAVGAREALVPALRDRVDAIAARAALAYVGSALRVDYERELAPFLEPARLEAILTLLGGVVS